MIQLITGPLAVGDSPGLATTDPRLTDIATLVQDGKYQDAASLSKDVLAEGIYDVRIIGYFAYGIFLEEGVSGLAQLFPALANLLTEDLEALGPVRNRQKHIQTILNWFMKQLAKKLQYEEERKTGLWDQWVASVSSEDVQGILEMSDGMRRALSTVLEDKAGSVLDGLSKVNEWLKHFQGVVYREPEPEVESEPEAEAQEAEVAPGPAPGTGLPGPQPDASVLQVGGSGALEVLQRKMAAFDALITEGKVALAALVAEDINGVIENFDPRVYFPELFSTFTLQYVSHINQLSTFKDHGACMEWKALKELYKVDLSRFVAFAEESVSFTFGPSGEASPPAGEYTIPGEEALGYGETDAGEGW